MAVRHYVKELFQEMVNNMKDQNYELSLGIANIIANSYNDEVYCIDILRMEKDGHT